MKIMLLAAAAVLSLSAGSAYANNSDSQAGGYLYPDYQFPTETAPSVATAPGNQATQGQVTHTYITNSNHGTWLFPPNDGRH
jgi:hypothetical protein